MSRIDEAERLFRAAFDKYRTPRSEAYKTGVRQSIEHNLAREAGIIDEALPCPFDVGTAEADAWFSGIAEGIGIVQEAKRARNGI